MRPGPVPSRVRWLACIEVSLAVAAFQFCTWVLAPRVGSPHMAWVFLGTLSVLAAYPALISARVWKRLGGHAWVRMPRPSAAECARDARPYAGLTVIAAAVVLLLSVHTNPAWQGVEPERLLRGLLRYVGLAAVQVYFYFIFLLPRIAVLLDSTDPADRRVWIALAAIFGLCHLPNVQLMVLGAAIAFAWAGLYRQRPNPLMLCASHVVLGTLLAEVAQLHMRLGVAYHDPTFRPFRVALRAALGEVIPLN